MKMLGLAGSQLVALVDDEDYELLAQLKWYPHRTVRASRSYTTYAKACDGRMMHRVILAPPRELVIDHIDGNGLNNQRHNLRVCTRSENQRNRHRVSSASGLKGVHRSSRGRWKVAICKDGKRHELGQFRDRIAAALVYDSAAIRLFGPFAKTNASLGLLPLPEGSAP